MRESVCVECASVLRGFVVLTGLWCERVCVVGVCSVRNGGCTCVCVCLLLCMLKRSCERVFAHVCVSVCVVVVRPRACCIDELRAHFDFLRLHFAHIVYGMHAEDAPTPVLNFLVQRWVRACT